MRDKLIACFLSLTLFITSAIPVQLAFAEPVESSEGSVNGVVELEVPDEVVTDSEGGEDGNLDYVPDRGSDRLDDGVLPLEETEVESTEQIAPYNTRAVPAVAVGAIKWLVDIGVGTAISTAIANAMTSSSTSKDVILLGGILETMVNKDGVSYINLIASRLATVVTQSASILEYVEDYLPGIRSRLTYSDDSGNVYYAGTLLRYIQNRLQATQDGTTYYAGSMLYYIWKNVDELESSLDALKSRLQYTTEGGTTNYAGSMLYYIWQNLRLSEDGESFSVAYLIDKMSDRFMYSDDSITLSPGSMLRYIQLRLQATDSDGTSYNAGTLLLYSWKRLVSLDDKFDALIDAVKDSSSPDVNIKVDPAADALGNSELAEDLIGSLDTVALAGELASLTALLEKAFPFCLIFGLVAIIELLVAPADAPSFDFPLPDGSGGTFVYTVDLSPFDPAAGVFRGMITIVYVIGLIRITQAFIYRGGGE